MTGVEAQYPEHEKMAKVIDKSQAIGEFLDWLQGENGYVIAEWNDQHETYYPMHQSPQAWLHRYFEIDAVQIEREKRAMLDGMRALHDDEVAG